MSEIQESLDAIFKALRSLNQTRAYLIHLDDLQEEFANSRAAADAASKANKLDETQKADYAKAAKALPDVAKGLKVAIIAFQKGDAMEGSAASWTSAPRSQQSWELWPPHHRRLAPSARSWERCSALSG